MINEGNLPESMIERATMLEGILVDRATGGSGENVNRTGFAGDRLV